MPKIKRGAGIKRKIKRGAGKRALIQEEKEKLKKKRIPRNTRGNMFAKRKTKKA